MLNATMCAVTRVICVLLEQNQTETGIQVNIFLGVLLLLFNSLKIFVFVGP